MLCVFLSSSLCVMPYSLVFAISTVFFFSISIIMVFPTECVLCLDEIIVCSFVVAVTIYSIFASIFPSFRVRPVTRESITEIIKKEA